MNPFHQSEQEIAKLAHEYRVQRARKLLKGAGFEEQPDGRLLPPKGFRLEEILVEVAKSDNPLFHPLFEWDDAKAAESFRKQAMLEAQEHGGGA